MKVIHAKAFAVKLVHESSIATFAAPLNAIIYFTFILKTTTFNACNEISLEILMFWKRGIDS